ncbi:serine protease [Nocardioides bruguierae]|uniref:Serine protease n=1 Tax=Nocardioides bruguierae TaxID=2945102 RepID=A0A9X2IEG5_9ACTN|nr:serine protease [Nocardioides bruguierae]MCM0619329.1 serine protease [Nocardioides bruguierae]
MQRAGTTGPACTGNDLALVRLPRRVHDLVNPSVPVWGGPTGLGDGLAAGETVLGYGASSLRAGENVLSPRAGTVLPADESARGWTHEVLTLTPGVPGDSGSGLLDARGRAVGTLSTLTLLPVPGSNGVSDLRRALDFARRHGAPRGLRVAVGTEPFTGPSTGLSTGQAPTS